MFRLIHQEGLEQFYTLKGSKTASPVNARAFDERPFEWLQGLVDEAEGRAEQGSVVELSLGMGGMSCVGCVWLIERVVGNQPGAIRASVDLGAGAVRLQWEAGGCDIIAIADQLRRFGYILKKESRGGRPTGQRTAVGGKLGLCGAFAMNSMAFTVPRYFGMPEDFAFAGVFEIVAAISATLSLLVGGSYFISRAVTGLAARVVTIDLPIALGISIAYAASIIGWATGHADLVYFDFVAMFVLLMLLGRYVQQVALEKGRSRSVSSPVTDTVRDEDGADISVGDLEKGVCYLLPPGSPAPVCSTVMREDATVSLDWISGESDPRLAPAGARIGSGTVNVGRGDVALRAEEPWEGSLLEQLLHARHQASPEEGRSPLLETVIQVYLYIVLAAGLVGGAIWWTTTGDVALATSVTISLFVVSCPCALGVAVPLADDLARLAMERMGVFIRRSGLWSRLNRVRDIVFDKTGTLTVEVPDLLNRSQSLDRLDSNARRVLATMVAGSLHPYCRSLSEALGGTERETLDGQLTDIPGSGVTLETPAGDEWRLGSRSWALNSGGEGSDCVLARNGTRKAAFQFRNSMRGAARSAISSLEASGRAVHILSGDAPDRVREAAAELGVRPGNAAGGLSPGDKEREVCKLNAASVLFIGDGANDSLAADKALVSGAAAVDKGSLEERVDFYFVGRSLEFVKHLFRVCSQRTRAVRLAFMFAAAYNISAGTICLAGNMNPLLAAVLMPISSLVTTGIVVSSSRSKTG